VIKLSNLYMLFLVFLFKMSENPKMNWDPISRQEYYGAKMFVCV